MNRHLQNLAVLGVTLLMLTTLGQQAAAQSITHESSGVKHPYDIALDYCRERGGLAQYSVQGSAKESVKGEVVKFSCSDDLTDVITISR